jgi:hypothetical protein
VGKCVRVLGQLLVIMRLVAWPAWLVVVVAIVVGTSVPDRASAAPLSWSSPALIDRVAPLADTTTGASVACPSVSLCVAFGDTAVEVSRNRRGQEVGARRDRSSRRARLVEVRGF